jgi:hypothetical protein
MGYIAIAIAIFLLAILAGCSGIKGSALSKGSKSDSSAIAETKSSQRDDIRQRLQKLTDSKAPKIRKVYAMCYATLISKENFEYVCPKCGEKTVFEYGFGFAKELEACRRAVKTIKKLKIELDESQFCRKCSPDVKEPYLVLLVYYKGEEEPYRAKGIGLSDIVLIKEFLSGSRKHVDVYGRVTPLKKYSKNLSRILGVEIEFPKKEDK